MHWRREQYFVTLSARFVSSLHQEMVINSVRNTSIYKILQVKGVLIAFDSSMQFQT